MREIESARLLLEPMTVSHAAESLLFWQPAALYQFIPGGPPDSLAALEQRYAKLESRTSPAGDEHWLNWFMRDKASRELVGMVQISLDKNRSAHLAYFVFHPRQRQGYATEACLAVLAELRSHYGALDAYADIDTRNTQSIALVERLGFQRSETKLEADFFKGERSDEYIYRLKL